jgi:nucleotide-binding universal stress UspA family protein
MTDSRTTHGRIVVGVDGSPGSREALRWAARQAELTGAELLAVTAWQYPAFFGWAPTGADEVDFTKVAEHTLTEALTALFGPQWPGWVRTEVIEGYPPHVLVEAAAGSDLLVVGCRGHGGFADMLLGSVSTYCVHHAHGPVTVIRPAAHRHHPQ